MIPSAATDRRLRRVAVVLACYGVWLLFHPYHGIWHDARLYTVAALHWLNPEAYAGDPWFAYGSQDDLTFFSPLYGLLVKVLGISNASWVAVLCGGLAWVMSTVALARTLHRGIACVASAIALSMATLSYSVSGVDVFSVSENFVTARLFSIPLVVWGLARATQERHFSAAALMVAAALLHPLMASGGIAVLLALRLTDRGRLILLCGLIALLVAGVVNPFGWWRLEPIGGEWMVLLRETGSSALLVPGDFNLGKVLLCLAVLLWGAELSSPASANVYRNVAFVSSWSLLFSAASCFFQPAALLVQIQLWRGFWLAVLCTVPAAIGLIQVVWKRGARGRSLLLLGSVVLIGCGVWGGAALLIAWFGYKRFPLGCAALVERCDPRRVVSVSVLLLLIVLPGLYLDLTMLGLGIRGAPVQGNVLYVLRAAEYYVLLPTILTYLVLRVRGRALWLAAALPVVALYFWDERPEMQRRQESLYLGHGRSGSFDQRITPGATVYWPANTMRVWFELGTASYAGEEQAVGLGFSEPRTFELRRRMERLPLRGNPETDAPYRHEPFNLRKYDYVMSMTSTGLRTLCADPVLDFVADATLLKIGRVSEQTDVAGGRRVKTYLYDCRDVRGARQD